MSKKSTVKKLIAIVLCLTLILQVIPMSVYAVDTVDTPESDIVEIDKSEIIGEDITLRDEYNKHFRMRKKTGDGSLS